MSYFQPPNGNGMGGPPPSSSYANHSSLAPRKSGRTMQATLNLAVNQYVEVKLDVNSPWIIGLVLAVCEVVGKSFGFGYEIKYQVGERAATRVFPANSPNIRAPQHAPQHAPQYAPQYAPQAPQYAPQAPQYAPQYAPQAPRY
ncbi:hypothetical protein C8F04DRAFT_1275647 [Mycena alexandri]|uniref:Uncharacterized protein n=1 Tax=Mycena alexandri TaxID=1745969 RepID=A0AAD6S3V7_9AGAR|nr:hypothetical protein C8F04DRAFT_1275647 [Mycena alexandri]